MRVTLSPTVLLVVLGLVTLTDGALWLGVHHLIYAESRDTQLYRMPAYQPDIPPDGISVDGKRIRLAPSSTPLWAIRYAAQGCEYCREDEPVWNDLATALRAHGFVVITVVPSARDGRPDDNAVLSSDREEVYVNIGWIKRYRLSMTPTVLIFKRDRGLVWQHQGTLARADVDSAIHTISP